MPFIQMPIADAVEQDLVPEGEYDLQITDVEEKDSKNGVPMLQCTIQVMNPPATVKEPAPIWHYITLPDSDDDAKKAAFKLRMLRRFLEVFSIPFEDNGFNSEDLNGAQGRCLVAQQEIMRDERPTGEYSHTLRLPKFKNESGGDETEATDTQSRRQRRRA